MLHPVYGKSQLLGDSDSGSDIDYDSDGSNEVEVEEDTKSIPETTVESTEWKNPSERSRSNAGPEVDAENANLRIPKTEPVSPKQLILHSDSSVTESSLSLSRASPSGPSREVAGNSKEKARVAYKRRIKDLNEENEELSNFISQLQVEKKEAKDITRSMISDHEQIILAYQEKINELRNEMTESTITIQTLTDEKQQINRTLDMVKLDLASEYDLTKQLQDEINSLQRKLDVSMQANESLQKDYDTVSKQLDNGRENIYSKDILIKEQCTNLSNAKSEISKLSEMHHKVLQDKMKYEKVVQDQVKIIADMQKEKEILAKTQAETTGAKLKDIEALKNRISSLSEENNALKFKVENYFDAQEQMQKKLLDSDRDRKNLLSKIEELQEAKSNEAAAEDLRKMTESLEAQRMEFAKFYEDRNAILCSGLEHINGAKKDALQMRDGLIVLIKDVRSAINGSQNESSTFEEILKGFEVLEGQLVKAHESMIKKLDAVMKTNAVEYHKSDEKENSMKTKVGKTLDEFKGQYKAFLNLEQKMRDNGENTALLQKNVEADIAAIQALNRTVDSKLKTGVGAVAVQQSREPSSVKQFTEKLCEVYWNDDSCEDFTIGVNAHKLVTRNKLNMEAVLLKSQCVSLIYMSNQDKTITETISSGYGDSDEASFRDAVANIKCNKSFMKKCNKKETSVVSKSTRNPQN